MEEKLTLYYHFDIVAFSKLTPLCQTLGFSLESLVITEIAQLQVRPELTVEFEAAFNTAQVIISSMPGYLGHELQRCIEQPSHYMLLVRWESVTHHEVGFRQSEQYQEWRQLLHHFYDPFPTVLHYELATGPGFHD